jgi:hypothetical protein
MIDGPNTQTSLRVSSENRGIDFDDIFSPLLKISLFDFQAVSRVWQPVNNRQLVEETIIDGPMAIYFMIPECTKKSKNQMPSTVQHRFLIGSFPRFSNYFQLSSTLD